MLVINVVLSIKIPFRRNGTCTGHVLLDRMGLDEMAWHRALGYIILLNLAPSRTCFYCLVLYWRRVRLKRSPMPIMQTASSPAWSMGVDEDSGGWLLPLVWSSCMSCFQRRNQCYFRASKETVPSSTSATSSFLKFCLLPLGVVASLRCVKLTFEPCAPHEFHRWNLCAQRTSFRGTTALQGKQHSYTRGKYCSSF